jgi:hypothetical protein
VLREFMANDFTGVGGSEYRPNERRGDPADRKAREALRAFFQENHSEVFFARQIEIFFEKQFFHWITARALRSLVGSGEVATAIRSIPSTGGEIHLFWNRRYRYYKRAAEEVISVVSEYARPNVAAAIGIHGEGMVLGGFADVQFVLRKREVNEYGGHKWTRSNHNLDFIFERDGLAYGVEVKNTLGYPDSGEIAIKIVLAQFLKVAPVFVARMMPKTVINEIWKAGGFALILGYQLYPFSHKELARRVAAKLRLPIDAPRRLSEGTMKRFTDWHEKRVKKV